MVGGVSWPKLELPVTSAETSYCSGTPVNTPGGTSFRGFLHGSWVNRPSQKPLEGLEADIELRVHLPATRNRKLHRFWRHIECEGRQITKLVKRLRSVIGANNVFSRSSGLPQLEHKRATWSAKIRLIAGQLLVQAHQSR